MPDLESWTSEQLLSRLRAVRKLARPDLGTLRLITDYQGRKVPTVGGILLFGRDRERHFPDAWIQAGRFAGADRSRIIDRVDIRFLPVQAVEEAIGFIDKHSLHGAEIGPVRRMERWSLPPVAIREAVMNAVAHADYAQSGAPIRVAIFDDRLEVENPGLLPFGLTIGLTPRATRTRLARLVGSGLVREVGTGPHDPKRRYFRVD